MGEYVSADVTVEASMQSSWILSGAADRDRGLISLSCDAADALDLLEDLPNFKRIVFVFSSVFLHSPPLLIRVLNFDF